ncbi:permeases of the major facilitator superfamily [alpha proteobacterium U9-1i]|nr:permeases of the major facilitator superfamily [alpha proteobacterium U9-1i]
MVGVLFSLYVFSWLDRLILSMLVGPIKADMVLSDFQIGQLLGPAFAISYAIFGLPLGWAVDRFSRRWIIFCGVTVWALATVASGFADTFEHLLIARIFVGVGEAALMPAAYSMLADEFPKERLTFATSTFQMGGKVGSAMAFGLGGLAIAYATTLGAVNFPLHGPAAPWQIVFAMVGFPGFLLALAVFTFREPRRRGVAAKSGADSHAQLMGFLRANWALITLMIVSFSCLSICGYTLTSWVPTYIGRAYEWTPLQYGPALSAMNLIAAASLVVNGRVVDHLFSRGMKDAHLRFYSWLMLAVSPAVVFLFMAPSAWVFLGLYCIVQFVTVPFMVYVSSVIALLAPNAVRGQLISIFLFCFTLLGLGAGPAMVGALTDFLFQDESKIGLSMMIVVVGCFAIAFVTMRAALALLGPSVTRAEAALATTPAPA